MEHTMKVVHTETYFPLAHGKLRFIGLGDIHFGLKSKVDKTKRVLHLASEMHPNYLLWLGDNLDTTNVIDDSQKREEFISLCKMSGSIAPTMIGLADHDVRYQGEQGIKEDWRPEFWDTVSKLPNVHVLHNCSYDDDTVHITGYTLPTYYYHREYPLPEESACSCDRVDDDTSVLLEDIENHQELLQGKQDKLNVLLLHSPSSIENDEVQQKLSSFQQIYCGHMHEGCTPPILDEIFPKNLGIISPQRTLFPKIARGIYPTKYGSLCILNGGITKIHESASCVLQPLNAFFPMHLNIVDVTSEEKAKQYVNKAYYKSTR